MAVNVDALNAFDFGGLLNNVYYVVLIIFLAGILFGVGWFIVNQLLWKHKLIIFEERSDGGTKILFDKGKIVRRRDNTTVFKVQGHKRVNLPPPPQHSMHVGNKGQSIILLRKFGNGDFDFYPFVLALRGVHVDIETFSHGRKNWISTEMRRSGERFGSWWERNKDWVIMFGSFTFAILMLIIIFKMNQDTVQMVGDVGADVAKTLKDVAKCSGQEIAQQTPPGT